MCENLSVEGVAGGTCVRAGEAAELSLSGAPLMYPNTVQTFSFCRG